MEGEPLVMFVIKKKNDVKYSQQKIISW